MLAFSPVEVFRQLVQVVSEFSDCPDPFQCQKLRLTGRVALIEDQKNVSGFVVFLLQDL